MDSDTRLLDSIEVAHSEFDQIAQTLLGFKGGQHYYKEISDLREVYEDTRKCVETGDLRVALWLAKSIRIDTCVLVARVWAFELDTEVDRVMHHEAHDDFTRQKCCVYKENLVRIQRMLDRRVFEDALQALQMAQARVLSLV